MPDIGVYPFGATRFVLGAEPETVDADITWENDVDTIASVRDATERLQADSALRDCVMEQTGDEILADAMFFGVRGGGSPVFPT